MCLCSFLPESNWGANAGLAVARDLLEPVKQKHPWISYSDLWTLAGATAIEAMGGEQQAGGGGGGGGRAARKRARGSASLLPAGQPAPLATQSRCCALLQAPTSPGALGAATLLPSSLWPCPMAACPTATRMQSTCATSSTGVLGLLYSIV